MKSDAFLPPASVREDRARPLSCRGRAFAMDHPSVKFCQAQAAAHAVQADATNLSNVRATNLTAARSWLRDAETARRLLTLRKRNPAADLRQLL